MDRFGKHQTIDDPEEADLILFIEREDPEGGSDLAFERLRQHPLVRQYREKCFMYNEGDHVWCVLPGVYCCMPRRYFDLSRQRAGAYLRTMNDNVLYSDPSAVEPEYLFSFQGRGIVGVRERVFQLDHSRGYVRDTTHIHKQFQRESDKNRAAMMEYAALLQRSKFVLCPRGVGTSSYRLFEAMKTGRAPVIISDQWVPPHGPDWASCSIRVAERDVGKIPDLLEQREAEWRYMGVAARRAWEQWFAPEVLFHWMVEACADLLVARRRPEAISQRLPNVAYLEQRLRFLVRPMNIRVHQLLAGD